jgi:ankyrin repeat protein
LRDISEESQAKKIKFSSIHDAVRAGDLNTVKILVAQDQSCINQQDNQSFTPVYIAAQFGHVEVVKYLHEQGANINASLTSGQLQGF